MCGGSFLPWSTPKLAAGAQEGAALLGCCGESCSCPVVRQGASVPSPAPCSPHNPPAGPQESTWLCPGVGRQGRDVVHWLFSFSPAPISCQLRHVKLICSPASLPSLKPPLGSPSLSLSLAFDVPDRHMVAGLSPWLLVHHCSPRWQPLLGDTALTG